MKFVSISLLAVLERCGAEAGSLRVIVQSFTTWTRDIEETLRAFTEFNIMLSDLLNVVSFKVSVHYLEKEMSDCFIVE